jgi:hypothetical protein
VSALFPPNAAPCTPTLLRDGERLFVPAGKQLLFAEEIELEGDAVIDVEGDLVEVS